MHGGETGRVGEIARGPAAARAADAWRGVEAGATSYVETLRRCGACGARVADFDWSTTPLGPIERWPEHLKQAVHATVACGSPMALWWGPELTTIFNDGFAPILGVRAETAIGRPFPEVWFDVWDDILPLVRRTLSGETIFMEELPLIVVRDGRETLCFFTFSYSPVRDETGRVVGLMDVVTETTEARRARTLIEEANATLTVEVDNARRALAAQRAAEQAQKLLQDELFHRMKNLLAVLQAIVTQTLRTAPSVEAAQASVNARIAAFVRTQAIFQGENWEHADLRAVLEVALAPYGDFADRIAIEGPPVRLSAQRSLGLALAIHELATNAIKYGALNEAAPSGRVAAAWDVDGGVLRFIWTERGGPPTSPPSQRGFGARLIEQAVAQYFSGVARLDFTPAGVVYQLAGGVEGPLVLAEEPDAGLTAWR